MGCKQCKIFLTSHHENKNSINSTIIEQNNQQSIIISPNEITPKISKRHRKLKYIKIDFPTLENLPVELIYNILDQLDTYTIFTSLYNVCTRLNSIIHTYDQYKLNFKSISLSDFHFICSLIRPEQIISLILSDGHNNVGLVELFLKNFQIESMKRLRSLTLINIDDSEQMIRIFLALTDQLHIVSIENSHENYNDTFMDILMTSIGKETLHKLSLDIGRNRILNPTIIWPTECFLHEMKFVGICDMSLFRNILLYSPNLKIFQAFDIDFDEEWNDQDDDDENEDDEIPQRQMLPISNASNLTSLSLIYARNEMEKLEWFLPQFTKLKYLKYLNVYDFRIESIYESDYGLLDGERWEKLLHDCQQFEFIFTIHIDDDDESWDVHHYLATFQTIFWQDKSWNIALEQYDKIILIYSLPYAHNSHYYDIPTFFSIPHNPSLLNKSMENVTKLRINMTAVSDLGKQIIGPPRFSHVSHLILDGQWRIPELADSLDSIVCLPKILKLIRLERVPTLIFRTFISRLINLQSLTLTTFVLDSMNAAVFQYLQCLHSLNIVQLDDDYRHFVNVEPFCTMFPRIKHLDIPIDNLDSCQYVIDRLEKYLISIIFRFPNNNDDDEDEDTDDEEDKNTELIQWAHNIRQNHQYRIHDGDIYLWLQ